ncbi:putative beta-lactamase-like 1 [Myotisia sp. PD_48]|nr:putative beta-lactamase-like 1 [Myotisia sp. PD_48]
MLASIFAFDVTPKTIPEPFWDGLEIRSLCPPTGPVLPPPRVPHGFQLKGLKHDLDGFVRSQNRWNASTNSFSVMVTSGDGPFFSYHHTAPIKSENGVKIVDDHSIYRIASVSKVFTTLATLVEQNVSLDDTIGMYLKELDAPGWQDVTLRLLAQQLSGVARDVGVFDAGSQSEVMIPLGLPPLPVSDIPACGNGTAPMCSREVFLQSLKDYGFTGQVAHRAAYTDIGYILLGYVLEEVTGMKYSEVLTKSILKPLGVHEISATTPDASRGIIPIDGDDWFKLDFGYYAPTAGLYGSVDSLSVFLRSILSNTLMNQAKTNEWLKPSAFTTHEGYAVGAPWEIFRPVILTKYPRPTDHYTKTGGLPIYGSHIVLVPEYNLGVTVLGAGADVDDIVLPVLDIVQQRLIPALDKLARRQALEKYGGRYQSRDRNFLMTLTIDDGPGLKVSSWVNRGVDILKTWDVLLFRAKSLDEAEPVDIRLYPQGVGNRWTAQFTERRKATANLHGEGPLARVNCPDWLRVDNFRYGKKRLDEVDFLVDGTNSIKGLDIPGWRVKLDKI